MDEDHGIARSVDARAKSFPGWDPIAPDAPFPKCDAHASERAGWRCSACDRALCVHCAVTRGAGHGQLVVCGECGEYAPALTRWRQMLPVEGWLADLVQFPFRAPAQLAMTIFVFGVLRFMWLPGAVAANALLATYVFHLARSTRLGEDVMPGFSDFRDAAAELLSLLRACGGVVVALAPLIGYHVLRAILFALGVPPAKAVFDVPSIPFVVAGLAWGPMALALLSVDAGLAAAFHPIRAIHAVKLDPPGALRTIVAFWLCFGVWWEIGEFAANLFPVPNFGLVLLEPARFVLALAAGRSLGLFLRSYAARLGWGLAREDADPVLGWERPTRVVDPDPPPSEVEAPRTVVEAIELSDAPVAVSDFVAWQPPQDGRSLDVDFERPASRRDPDAPRSQQRSENKAVSEDLMSEEEFEKSVGGPGGAKPE